VAASGTPGGFNLQNNSNQSSPPALTGDVVLGEYHEYLHVFEAREDQGLPPHRHHDHHIPLLEGKMLAFEPIRALDENRLRALREYLETNLERGWIQESTSPAGAPIHFVQKKDGSLRLCVDYRGLNAMTVKDRTPLPLIGEALNRLANAKIYTKLDVKDAYHNLQIAEGDEWKMAFRDKYGLYEYLVMPFRLTNRPASFQRWMNEVPSDYLDVFCIAYLDDMVMPFRLTNAPASFQRWMNEVPSDYLEVFCIAYLDDILIYSDNLCHGVDQMAAPLVLMHAYPSAYAYRFDHVCLRYYLLMHIYFCLWFLMFAYDIYACLCMFIYLLMGLLELCSMEEREVVSRNFSIEVG
jgi:hypothetical protein